VGRRRPPPFQWHVRPGNLGRRPAPAVARPRPDGIKPLYFSLQNGTLCFGSEIRPVRAALPKPPAADVEAIGLFLRYRYTPAPRTMFSGIQKLAAGEKLVVENGKAEVSRYYNFEPVPFDPHPGSRKRRRSCSSSTKAP